MDYHTSEPSSPQASVTSQQATIIEVFQELLTQTSSLPSHDDHPKRGRPPTLLIQHVWLALLVGIFESCGSFRSIWRALVVSSLGSFAAITMTYEGMRKRLLSQGCGDLAHLSEQIRQVLAQRDRPVSHSALPLAPFAREIVALDETTLDKLKRLIDDLKAIPDGDPHLLVGKLAGLFDLRRQQWRCLQLRTDTLAACSTGVLQLLDGLPQGSLILADLGYFSFRWFDALAHLGYFYISRLRENGTYRTLQVLYEDREQHVLDAIIWLGAYRADRAAHAVRLVQFELRGVVHQYITNVLDPQELPITDIAQLYARRWDIELQFKLLKCELGIHIWWAARPELVEMQLWIVLILAQILCALRFDIAQQADVELFDVSLPILMDVLKRITEPSEPLVQLVVEHGRRWGVIRPHRRKPIGVPAINVGGYQPLSPALVLLQKPRYAGRNPHPRKQAFLPRYQDHFLIDSP